MDLRRLLCGVGEVLYTESDRHIFIAER